MTRIAKRVHDTRALLALAGLCAIAIVAFGGVADIMKEVVGADLKNGNLNSVLASAERLADWAIKLSIIICPVALGGCAIAMQIGGNKRMMGPAYASIGAVLLAVLARAMAG